MTEQSIPAHSLKAGDKIWVTNADGVGIYATTLTAAATRTQPDGDQSLAVMLGLPLDATLKVEREL